MATLTAWTFNTPQGADETLDRLEKLSRDYLINLHDAAVVSWEVGNSMRDVGISDDFIRDVREKVTPGTSALFVLSTGAVQDRWRTSSGARRPS